MSFECIRHIAGKAAVGVEGAKHSQIDKIIDEKELAIEQIDKIHHFLSLAIWRNAESKDDIFLEDPPYCDMVDELREIVGVDIIPEGVYKWKGKEQIQGLHAALETRIQDLTAQMTVQDMRIAHLLDQVKQMLESLRKIAEMEQHSVDATIRKSSKTGG